jgi:hypothetical protein
LPDGGNPKPSSGGGSGDPFWHTGFDSVFDLLDFYADQGFTITLGTNIQFSKHPFQILSNDEVPVLFSYKKGLCVTPKLSVYNRTFVKHLMQGRQASWL